MYLEGKTVVDDVRTKQISCGVNSATELIDL
jgi:hypothetical protein